MDRNVIHNIADHYAREYDVLDRKNDLMKLIETHDNQPFYIFRYLSLVKNLIVSKNLKYTIEVPSRREDHFLEDLKKKKMFYTSDQTENHERAAGKRIFR